MIPQGLTAKEIAALNALRPHFEAAASATGVRASLLAAIAWRESRFGLDNRDGCGDWTLRPAARYGPPRYRSPAALQLLEVNDPQRGWIWPRDDHGISRPGPMCLPFDRRGFGRGVMQLDWCSYPDLAESTWRNHGENILAGAKCYRAKFDWLADRPRPWDPGMLERAAIAAYNGGEHRAYAHVLDGRDPDWGTTGRDYGRWVRAAEVAILAAWE